MNNSSKLGFLGARYLSYLLMAIALIACQDRFAEAYDASALMRKTLLSDDRSSLAWDTLAQPYSHVCIIQYMMDSNYLPSVNGKKLTDAQVYIPPGDQYATILLISDFKWTQVVFQARELNVANNLVASIKTNDFCVLKSKVEISRPVSGKHLIIQAVKDRPNA